MNALPSRAELLAASAAPAVTAPSLRPGATPAEARKAGEEFEAVFLTQMLQHMFKGVPVDGLFGGGQGEGVYRSLLLQEYGKILSKAGGVGIADAVTRELMKLQEQS